MNEMLESEAAPRGRWMPRACRAVLRLSAATAVLVLLVGVPLALVRVIDVAVPSGLSVRSVVMSQHLDPRLVVVAGAVVFVVLWSWFAVSAMAEVWVSLRWRLGAQEVPLEPVGAGPSRWLRALVRFAIVSSATAGLAVAVTVPTAAGARSAAADAGTRVSTLVSGETLIAPPHAASSTVDDAEGATAARLRDQRWSAGSLSVESSAVGPPSADGVSAVSPSFVVRSGGPGSLAGAVMFGAGALALLEASRRRRLRSSMPGARLDAPSLSRARAEMALRSLDAHERLVRLDVALRVVAPALAAVGAQPTVMLIDAGGSVRVLPSRPVSPDASTAEGSLWHVEPGGAMWCLPGAVPLERLAALSRSDAPPCPALLHLGAGDAGELFVDLEGIGVLTVESDAHGAALDAALATLEVSPFLQMSRVLAVGFDDDRRAGLCEGAASRDTSVDSLDAALDAAAVLLGETVDAVEGSSTFERRVSTRGGEAWEPCVIVVDGCADEDVALLRRIVRPGSGLAAVVGVGRRSTGLADEVAADIHWRLVPDPRRTGGHVLQPLGIAVRLAAVDRPVLREVARLLGAEREPLPVEAPVVSIDVARGPTAPFVEPEWRLMVRLLGGVEVVSAEGMVASFEKSKALELVAWLALHRRRPTRSGARAALWDVEVKDATFANVVSEARRALGHAAGCAGDDWIGRTLTDALPLHEAVVSDADLLEARLRYAAGLSHRDAVDVLTPGVELIGGMPFAGTGYLWGDAEGHSSSLVLLAVDAVTQLATHHLALGDVEGVFWATGRGLSVLNGHEELISLRMRAHAGRGDLAGVRAEWERYERSLLADPWASPEPSPKLAALRRELLSMSESRVRGSNS